MPAPDHPASGKETPPQPTSPQRSPGDEADPGSPGTGEDLCPACHGSGSLAGKACPQCGGTGRVTEGIGGG